ncbi:hypothetical protein [Yoonia maritima]|uniref:hypothetical protein n=1 Tax=Yoonia maritima TaxID=1435347 RepID=UPI001A9C300F|nr:hypothetical protein [Yoonia maritima]
MLVTPGVSYVANNSHPECYIAPVYAKGKEHLGDFIEPLVAHWIEFEATLLGMTAEVEIVDEFDEKSLMSRPKK